MAEFTAKDVQKLRETTGVGMMECKKALVEAEGDFDKAAVLLRERGLAAAAKKADRVAAEGLVATVSNGTSAVVVEVNAETDFVAKNQDFVDFVNSVALTVLENDLENVESLLQTKLSGTSQTVEEALREKILVIGENMNVRRFKKYSGVVGDYLHANKRIGVLVKFAADQSVMDNEEFATVAKDIAMQVAAISPKYIRREDVPADEVEAEKKFLTEQVVKEGKPENIAQKIVEGRIGKFFEQICLEEQTFIKDGSMKVVEYLNNAAKNIGKDIKIEEFARFEVGEGIEKKEDDFAAEVASMMK